MQIREAKIEDLKQITIILEQIARMHYENRPDIFRKKSKKQIEKDLIEEINDDEKNVIIATDESSKVYGILICRIKETKAHINLKNSKTLWIEELGVNEKYRKNGIGKQLMKKAEEMAKKLGCKRIELNCWNFNQNAVNFYKAFGMDSQRIIFEKEIKQKSIFM